MRFLHRGGSVLARHAIFHKQIGLALLSNPERPTDARHRDAIQSAKTGGRKKKELFLYFLPAANCCCRLPPQFLFFYVPQSEYSTVLIRQSPGRVKITISHPLPLRNVCLETSKVSQLPSECGTPRKKSVKKSRKTKGKKMIIIPLFFSSFLEYFFLGRHSMPYKDDIHFAVDAGGRDTMAADNFPRARKVCWWGG